MMLIMLAVERLFMKLMMYILSVVSTHLLSFLVFFGLFNRKIKCKIGVDEFFITCVIFFVASMFFPLLAFIVLVFDLGDNF